MFNQIFFTQVRWTRVALGSMAFAAFLMPAVAWWLGGMRVLDPATMLAPTLCARDIAMRRWTSTGLPSH